jgi:elongation factor G
LKDFQPTQIRNAALVSHHGTGKTSLTESFLWRTKATSRHGKIEDGTTALDFSPEEIHRKITISLGLAPVEWRGHKINVIDTPGYADFIGDAVAGLAASDSAILCLKGAAGVEAGTEMIWERVLERACPVICAVTQMEKEHASFSKTILGASERLGTRFVAVAWPIGEADKFRGVVDLAANKALMFEKDGSHKEAPIPAELEAEVQRARSALVDAAAEADDQLLEKFLGGEELSVEEIHKGLREGVLHRSFVPAVPVAAVPMLGNRLPHGHDPRSPSLTGRSGGSEDREPGTEEKIEMKPEQSGHLAALVFKTSSESHAGDLSMIRVFSGTLAPGKEVWNCSAQRAEKIGQLFTIKGEGPDRRGKHSRGRHRRGREASRDAHGTDPVRQEPPGRAVPDPVPRLGARGRDPSEIEG